MSKAFMSELSKIGIKEEDFAGACAYLHRAILELNQVEDDKLGIALESSFFLSEVMYFVLSKDVSFGSKLFDVATPDGKVLKLTAGEVLISKAFTSSPSLSLPYDVVTKSLYVLFGESISDESAAVFSRVHLLRTFLGERFSEIEVSFLSKHHSLEKNEVEETELTKFESLGTKVDSLVSELSIEKTALKKAVDQMLSFIDKDKLFSITGIPSPLLAKSFLLPALLAKSDPQGKATLRTASLSPKNLTNLDFFISDFFLESAKELELSRQGALSGSPLYHKLLSYCDLFSIDLPDSALLNESMDQPEVALLLFPKFAETVFGSDLTNKALDLFILNAQSVKDNS